MKIQEKSESFYFFPEITCIRSHYLDVRIFRYPDIYSDIYNIYNIYSPPKFSRICSYKHYWTMAGWTMGASAVRGQGQAGGGGGASISMQVIITSG